MHEFLKQLRKVMFRILDQKDALIFPIALVALIVGLITAIPQLRDSGETDKESIDEFKVVFLVIFPLMLATAALMVRFLSGATQRLFYSSDRHKMRFIQQALNELEHSKSVLDSEEKHAIVEDLANRLKNESSEELMDSIRDELKESDFRRAISKRAETTLGRIYSELDALARRGTLNLVLGVVLALTGIGLLGFVVLGSSEHPSSLQDFAMTFLPRLSIVALVELFSYFFLRLYKSSLDEIKYFQNEATNIEFHFVALEAAIHSEKEELSTEAIKSFLKTDRNHLLSNGMTSRDRSEKQLLDENHRYSAEMLVDVIKAVRGTENKS